MSSPKTKSAKNEFKRQKDGVKNISNEDMPISIEEENDGCVCPERAAEKSPFTMRTPGLDPRFQQQNQTLRCYVMYTDFYQCQHILGTDAEACTWFKDVFTSICPQDWVQRWDDWRAENRMPWHKRYHDFPEGPYGKRQ